MQKGSQFLFAKRNPHSFLSSSFFSRKFHMACLKMLKSLLDKMIFFARLWNAVQFHADCWYRFLLSHAHPLLTHIFYFVSLSSLGFLLLKFLQPGLNQPRDIDFFFTSVSAATISSMSTVEMEVFSNAQLVVLTILMLLGGEVLTSTLGLHFTTKKLKLKSLASSAQIQPADSASPIELSDLDHLESGTMAVQSQYSTTSSTAAELRYNAMSCLANFLKGYLLFIHVAGSISIILYVCLVSSARETLRKKHIMVSTFSVFTTVSSFSNCGFIPTNENMMVFKNNSGLLLLIIPQVLLGNTVFPSCLRLCLWAMRRLTKKPEYDYLMKSWKETGFYHLLPYRRSLLLVFTVLLFITVQMIVICSLEWSSEVLSGMNSYQKFIGMLFLSVNSRHAGESVVDLSSLSKAVLVLFVVMMYLPPYTTLSPMEDGRCTSSIATEEKRSPGLAKSLAMSQLSYLAISVMLVCITERKRLTEDPLNFNVLNIAIEVISAYGNVGFSTGYSCARQLKPDGNCKDHWYGFVGKWSTKGKLILILVMFYGRLKKFSMKSGQAWKLG